ncbi:siroheme synthase [Flavobacterium supellecticarium]|uniref:Probable membrane transporter protein n=2 Tax=Flavobacterium supellecticarium TaxID=2565924 RepID=A0A4S4A465_9FLAO|nr:TSUP family transporter [Flavobacterium supellecticarium]THF53264.1 siroheme synthase [Flavobacterium supellecticarium]
MKNNLFPIFLKSDSYRFLIVGGGNVGLEKAETLLRQNPLTTLTVVAQKINSGLRQLQQKHPQLIVRERSFEENDLDTTDFLIIATDNTALNRDIKQKANDKGIWVNAADQPDLCDFYLGSIVNKGYLKIAISTNGKSPVLARRLREHLEEAIPDTISDSIENLNAFREQHKGDIQAKLTSLNKATEALVKETDKREGKKYKELTFEITVVFLAVFFGYGLSSIISVAELNGYIREIPPAFYGMVLVGFFAQLVDGAVGLGYGVTCATSMMLFGIKLPAISGSIHTAEMFSSGISGFSHYKFGNVNKKLLLWLAIPGVVGAISGALLLIYLGNKYETITYAVLATYTMIIGIRLVLIALRKKIVRKKIKNTGLLGFSGGLFDAFGGGGWGPIVTSTLLAKGRKSSYVVGTVSLAEFFVTLAASATFFASLGVSHWYIVVGLIFGGSIAAPLAARLAGKLPQKTAILAVAFLVIVFSIRMLFKIF